MNELTVGILGLFLLMGIFLTGFPIAFAMAVVGFLGFMVLNNFDVATTILANDIFEYLSSYSLTAVVLFMFMGQLAANSSIAKGLYNAAHRFLGHMPGGLATATVIGATVFKSICGSMLATSATFASVAIPEMDRYNYSKKLSTGVVASVGTLGNLLPPSVILIILGIMTEQSIGKIFLAGVIPGLILAFLFIVVIFGWCGINPNLGPRSERSPWIERWKAVPVVMWPILIFVVLVGGLMFGVFTPTEAGSIGAFAVLILCILRKDMNSSTFMKSVRETTRASCMVLILVAMGMVLSHFAAATQLTDAVGTWVTGLQLHRVLIMCIIIMIFLIGGSIIDDMAFLIIATPIFFPMMVKLGYDPLWVIIMLALIMSLGVIIPPLAVTVFIVKQITNTPISVIYRGVLPFLISLIVCMALMFIFPQMATYLPNMFMK